MDEVHLCKTVLSTSTWSSHDPPSDHMCWVPSYFKQFSLPYNPEVTVDVIEVVADEDIVEVPVLVTVDVLGLLLTVDV